LIGSYGVERGEFISRQGFLRQEKLRAFVEVSASRLKALCGAVESLLNDSPYGHVDFSLGGFSDLHAIRHNAGQKGLLGRRISSLPQFVIHTVTCDHFEGNIRRSLKVISCTG
jgi:hypothetical protein